jgi:hypothetical protein
VAGPQTGRASSDAVRVGGGGGRGGGTWPRAPSVGRLPYPTGLTLGWSGYRPSKAEPR